jgi:hypothetical protein
MPWVRQERGWDQPVEERWVDDGSPLSRYEYLQIIIRGYGALGVKAPEELSAEYQALVAEKTAELERATQLEAMRQLAMFGWKARPVNFTDITNA